MNNISHLFTPITGLRYHIPVLNESISVVSASSHAHFPNSIFDTVQCWCSRIKTKCTYYAIFNIWKYVWKLCNSIRSVESAPHDLHTTYVRSSTYRTQLDRNSLLNRIRVQNLKLGIGQMVSVWTMAASIYIATHSGVCYCSWSTRCRSTTSHRSIVERTYQSLFPLNGHFSFAVSFLYSTEIVFSLFVQSGRFFFHIGMLILWRSSLSNIAEKASLFSPSLLQYKEKGNELLHKSRKTHFEIHCVSCAIWRIVIYVYDALCTVCAPMIFLLNIMCNRTACKNPK